MPLDHYVSQVYLRNFYSPALGERMFALRKSDLKAFTPNSESVCRIPDGNSNSYLNKHRAIEEFLKNIEPKYNSSLSKILLNKLDSECVYTIAGFIAYISTCSPTAMRAHSAPLKSIVKTTARMLDQQGQMPEAPETLGSKSITDLLNNGSIKINVDPKYPQAVGITSILDLTSALGNFTWEFLHNTFDDSPFFTSDYPVALENTNDLRVMNKIVPLAPNLLVRIIPDFSQSKNELDFSFKNSRYRFRKVTRNEVAQLNCLIVRSAEDTIFYKSDFLWVKPFITKNRNFRIENFTDELKTSTSTILISRQKIVALTSRLND